MSFKSNIPEQVLAHPNTRKFVSVMDGVNEVKSDIIFTSLRAYNPALLLVTMGLISYLWSFRYLLYSSFFLMRILSLAQEGAKKALNCFLA